MYLHAVGVHDAHRHKLGEDPQQFRVGQHAVFQTVIQETGMMAENVVDIRRLQRQRKVDKWL